VSTPTVTITVGGVPVSAMTKTPFTGDLAELDGALHMLYVQAIKDDRRVQWVVFPPAVSALVLPSGVTANPNTVLILNRTQEFVGNRSKWFHKYVNSYGAFGMDLTKFGEQGYALSEPVVTPLETDDYQTAWSGDTPHKALRAVDRTLKPLGLSVK
jgi:hypothetical protein